MSEEQPEQFFLRVWLEALAVASKDAIAFKPKQDYAAALALQRAFAEREAELVGALERIAAPAIVPLDQCPDADQPNGWRDLAVNRIDIARTALKSREAGHG